MLQPVVKSHEYCIMSIQIHNYIPKYIICLCVHACVCHVCVLELKQISEISRYLFETHYPDTGLESFRIVAEIYIACQRNYGY